MRKMKERVTIEFEKGTLEGVIQNAENSRGVIITHPHPGYGGNMNNIIVRKLEQAYLDHGYATLRFNFRGTGKSKGPCDTFFDLCEDVIAAASFLQERGIIRLALAGYSFGTWVNAHTNFRTTLLHQMLISPPVSFMDFTDVPGFSCPSFVICGDRDEFADKTELKHCLTRWDITSFEQLSGCDHFYSGKGKLLSDCVSGFICS